MKKITSSLCFLSVALLGVQAESAPTKSTVVATVNGKSITLEYLNRKFDESMRYAQGRAPTKKDVLDDLIKREIGIQEAIKQGLNKDPEVVDKTNTVLYNALVEKRLAKDFEKIDVTESEAKTYYSKWPEIRTSQIFVPAMEGAPKEIETRAHERIKSVLSTVQEGKMSFSEIAQKFSEGVEAPMGGDLDYQTRDRLDLAYYDAALALKSPGKTSGVIRSRYGFHIAKLTAIRPWDEVDTAKIKRIVFEQKRQEIFDRYMAQLRGSARVTVNQAAIKE